MEINAGRCPSRWSRKKRDFIFSGKKVHQLPTFRTKKLRSHFILFLAPPTIFFVEKKNNWPVGFLLESENGFKIERDQKKMNAAVITIFYFILHYSGLHFHIFILFFLQNGKIIKRSATGG